MHKVSFFRLFLYNIFQTKIYYVNNNGQGTETFLFEKNCLYLIFCIEYKFIQLIIKMFHSHFTGALHLKKLVCKTKKIVTCYSWV